MHNPNIIELNANKFPAAVLASTAIWIHLLSVSARSSSLGQVRMVTATRSFRHCVLSMRSFRNCRPWSNIKSSIPVQSNGFSFLMGPSTSPKNVFKSINVESWPSPKTYPKWVWYLHEWCDWRWFESSFRLSSFWMSTTFRCREVWSHCRATIRCGKARDRTSEIAQWAECPSLL